MNKFICIKSFDPNVILKVVFYYNIDLHICNNSNTRNESYSDLGHSYKHSYYAFGSNEAILFLAGLYNFLTTEIEVYTIV